MEPGTAFRPVIADKVPDIKKVKRVILCSGKFYYEIAKAGQNSKLKDATAIIRLEELAPFPYSNLSAAVAEYTNATEYVWVQEEPLNSGAWSYAYPHVQRLLSKQGGKLKRVLDFVGRPSLAAPAVGLSVTHHEQAKELMAKVWPE